MVRGEEHYKKGTCAPVEPEERQEHEGKVGKSRRIRLRRGWTGDLHR